MTSDLFSHQKGWLVDCVGPLDPGASVQDSWTDLTVISSGLNRQTHEKTPLSIDFYI